MAHIIVNVDALGVLTGNQLPDGVTPNPFKDAIEFLDKTSGRFWHEFYVWRAGLMTWQQRQIYGRSQAGGRSFMTDWINREAGVDPSAIEDLYLSPWFRPGFLSLTEIASGLGLMQSLGVYFEVVDYPMFVTIADADYDDPVPGYLPGSTSLDENEEPQPVTWRNWRLPNYEHLALEGQNYIRLNCATGSYVAGSVLAQLQAAGFTLGLLSDFPVVEPVEDPA